MGPGVGADPRLGEGLIGERALVVDADLGYFEQVPERLYTGHSRPDFSTGAYGDSGGQHMSWSERRCYSGQLH